nr:hypothetical protein [Bacillus velezensis]
MDQPAVFSWDEADQLIAIRSGRFVGGMRRLPCGPPVKDIG